MQGGAGQGVHMPKHICKGYMVIKSTYGMQKNVSHDLVMRIRIGVTRIIKRIHFCKHFVEKVGVKTKIYSPIYKELVTGQMALRHYLYKAWVQVHKAAHCPRGRGHHSAHLSAHKAQAGQGGASPHLGQPCDLFLPRLV